MATERLSRTEQLAVEKRNRMSAIEAEYLRTKEYEKSPQYVTDKLVALTKVRSILRMGSVTDSEALLMVGRIQQILIDVFNHENVLLEYEELKKSLMERFPK